MRKPMTVAVIGCGRFAKNFVPLFKAHPAVARVLVCDLIPERAKQYAESFGVEIIDTFEQALASSEVDAIAIFTQRDKHGPMAIAALEAGKHVYSAVPCAVDVADIIRIKELVERTHLTYSMGETGFYRPAAVFCREEQKKGTFGTFTYGEAQYNHDVRNMEQSFRSSGGEAWRRYAGIPPMFYPTHSTAMILSALPGVYVKRLCAFGYSQGARDDIYGTEGQNLYGNPFANTSMLLYLSNGGIARISENRCIGWRAPETYISQFYGSEGAYEFSVAHHHLATYREDDPHNVTMTDVTDRLMPPEATRMIRESYADAIQSLADGFGFGLTSPVQPTARLPKEFEGLHNGHNGTHHFLIDDFCRACETGKLSPCNIWEVARWNIPGLMAHQSALAGGETVDVIDLGAPPADWEVLDYATGR